jgi:hypothetical protein
MMRLTRPSRITVSRIEARRGVVVGAIATLAASVAALTIGGMSAVDPVGPALA